jgi:hypothetical protein
VLVADVHGHGHRDTTRGGDLADGGFGGSSVEIGDADSAPFTCEAERDLPADTAASTGHHG